jgi:hypothetical protein
MACVEGGAAPAATPTVEFHPEMVPSMVEKRKAAGAPGAKRKSVGLALAIVPVENTVDPGCARCRSVVDELIACRLIRSLLEARSLETSKIAWTTLAWRLHILRLRQALYANQF